MKQELFCQTIDFWCIQDETGSQTLYTDIRSLLIYFLYFEHF